MEWTRTTRAAIGGLTQRIVRGTCRLPACQAKGTIKRAKGIGRPGATNPSGTSGIASPLTEVSKTRSYFSTIRELTSSDGLFMLEYQNIRQLTTKDAGLREVKIIFDDPDTWM